MPELANIVVFLLELATKVLEKYITRIEKLENPPNINTLARVAHRKSVVQL